MASRDYNLQSILDLLAPFYKMPITRRKQVLRLSYLWPTTINGWTTYACLLAEKGSLELWTRGLARAG